MKISKKDMLLYLVTDRRWLTNQSLTGVIELAIEGNVTFIQLREKDLEYNEFKELAIKVKEIADKYEIPFVINDNIKIALEVDADGVHVGQSDLIAARARELLGPDKILGVSASNIEQAIEAEKAGANYLGIGSVFSTTSKLDATDIRLIEIKKIVEVVNIPTVGIGGINKENIHLLKGSGLNGVAVISAILAQKDIKKAAKDLYELSGEIFNESYNI